ncbi:Mitogen-activated protein kinase kinase kinase 2 [Diplonema papillatum]|nr:Mitogen-activated protein kinase kinase kinase 2 [Diplonema papillatum]
MEYATLLCLVVAVGLAAARGRALVVLLLAWRGRRSGKRKDDDVESNRRRPPRPQAAAFLSFRRPGGGAGAAAGGSGREADEENGSPAPSPRTLSFEWPRRSEETHAATGSDDTGSAVSNTSDAVLSWKPAHEREAVGVAGSHATRHRPGGVETAACERPERAKPAARETEDLPGQSVRPVLSFEWPRHSEESHTAAGSDDTGSAVSNSSDSVLSWKPSRERDAVRVAGSRDADTAVSNDADSVLSSKQPPCKRGGAHAAGTTHSSNNPAPVFSCEPLRIAGSREGDDARELSADRRDAKESRGTDDRPTPPHRGGGLTQRDRKQAGSTPATLCGTPAFAPFAKGTPLPPGTPASAQDSPLILPLPCSRFSTPTFAPADPVASPSSRLLPAASLYLPMPDAALAAGQPGRAADGWARPRAMRSRPGFDVSNLLPLDVSGASLHLFPPSPAGAAPGAAAGATPGRLDSSRSSLHLCPPSPADATPCATGRVSGQLDSSRSSLHLCPPSPADGAATGGASGQLDSSLTSLHLCPPSPADATLGTAAGAAPGQLDSSLASLHLYCPSSADATPGATTPGQLDPSRASLHLRPLSPAGAAGHHAAPGTATSVPHSTQASLPPYPPSPAAEATGRHVTPSMPTSTTRGPLNLYPPSPVCTAGHHATPSTATSIPFSSQTSLRAHPASPAGAAGHQSSLVTSGYLGRVQKAKVASSTSPEVLGSPPGLQRLCPAGSGSADGGGHGPGACANANHFTTISYHKPVASLPSVPSSPHPSHAASKHPPCAVDSLPIDPSDLRTSWKRFHCTSSSPCHVPGGQSHGLCAQPDPTYRDPLWSDCSNLPSSVPGSPLHAPLAPRARNAASGHTCLMNASSPRHGPAGLHDPPLWRCSIMPHSVPSSPFHGPAGSRLQGSAHASDAPAHAFCRGVPSWLGVSCSVPSSPCHTFAAPSPREIAHHFKSPASVPSTPHHTFGKLDAAAVPHALACFSSMPSSVPSSPSHTLTAPSPRGDQRAPLEISHYARAPFPPLSSSLPSTPHHASGRHDAASAPHTLACFSNMPSSVPSSPCHMARTRGALACKPAASVPNSPCNASTTPTAVCATTYSFCLAQHTLTTLTNGEHATESLLSNVGVAFRTFDKPDKPGLSGWSSVPGSPCAGATRGRTHDHLAASTAAAAVAPGDQCQPQAPADMPQASSRLPSYNSGANAGRFHDNSAPASASASQQNGGGGFLQASPSVPSFPCPGAMAGRVHDALGVSSSFPSSSASQRRPQAQNQIVGGPGPLQAPPSVPISPCTRAPAAAAHQQKCAAGVAPCEVKQPAAVDAEDGPPMQAQVVVRHRGGPGPGMPAVSPKENGLDSLSLHACAWDAVWKATAASSLAPLPSFSPASRTLVLAVPSPSHTGRRGFDSRLFGSPGAFPSSSLPPSRRSSEAGTPGGGLPGVDPPAGELGGLAAFSLCPPAIPLAAPPPAPGHRRWSRPQLLPSSGSISCCAGPPRAGLPPAGALCGSSGRQPRLPAGGPFAGQSGSSHSSHTVVEPPAERPCSGQLGSSPLSHTVVEPVEIPVSGQSGSSPSSHTVVEPPAERPFSGPSGSSLPSGTVVDQPPERPFPGSSGGSPSSHAVVEPPAGSPPSGSPSSRAPPPSETRPPSFSHSLAPTAAPGSPASPHTSEPQVSPDGPGAQTSPSASPAAGPREGLQPSVSPLTPCPLSCLSMDHPSLNSPQSSPGAPAAETRWKYGNLLGSGAFGQVYVAMDASQGTLAAVKIVSFAYGGDPDALRKRLQGLKTEIDVMKHLRHPNIVRYLDTERRGHSLHIFMEYVPGGSIADNITRFGSLSQPVVVAYTGQVLEGLAYLHSKRVVHRDIKGANILLAVDGSCKLGDFGAATLMGTDPHKSVVGTMNWMPPEVITGQCHSLTCDVWSLGCTVLEMLTADLPWAHVRPAGAPRKKPTTLQVVTHVVSCADYGPGLLACLAGLCSPAGAAFVLACLRKEPATRPTVAELIRHPWMRERGGGVPLARGPARGESGAPGCGLLSRENDDLRRLREKEEGGGLLLLQEKEKLLSEEGKASDNLLLRENDDLCRLREKKEGGSLLFPEKEKLVSEEEEAGDALLLRENENLPSQTKEAGSNLPLQKTEEGSNLRLLSNEDESVPGSPSSQEEEGKLLATGSPPMRERIEKVPLDRRGEPGVSLQEEVDDLAAGSPSLREDKEGSAPETEDSAVPEGPARGFTVQPQPQKSDEDCSGDRRAAGAPPGESAAAHRDSRWDAPARGAQRNRSARGGAWVPPKIKVRPFGLRNANTAPRRAASMKE